jgi:hypothetical protein
VSKICREFDEGNCYGKNKSEKAARECFQWGLLF